LSNYYVALISSFRPDVHITLDYHKNLNADEVHELCNSINDLVEKHKPEAFDLKWDFEGWFGRNNSVRVLQPRIGSAMMPPWVYEFVSKPMSWNPHISCSDEEIELRIDRVSVMCRSVEIAIWSLEKDPGKKYHD